MNSNIIKLLLVLCVMLLIILFIEWEIAEPGINLDIETSATKEESQNKSQKLTEIKLTKQSVESYSEMVDSPLFIKGRKPVAGFEEETEGQVDSRIEDLYLVGIYSAEERMVALFSTKGRDGKYLKKAKGDDVSGWMLEEIMVDKVILERDGKKQTLMLRTPKPKLPKKNISAARKRNKK